MKTKRILFLSIINCLQIVSANTTTSDSVKTLDTSAIKSTVNISYESDLLKSNTSNHKSNLGLDASFSKVFKNKNTLKGSFYLNRNLQTKQSQLEKIKLSYSIPYNFKLNSKGSLSVSIPTTSIFNDNNFDVKYGNITYDHIVQYNEFYLVSQINYNFYKYKLNSQSEFNTPVTLALVVGGDFSYKSFSIGLGLGYLKSFSYDSSVEDNFLNSQSISYIFDKKNILTIGHEISDSLRNSYSFFNNYSSQYYINFKREF